MFVILKYYTSQIVFKIQLKRVILLALWSSRPAFPTLKIAISYFHLRGVLSTRCIFSYTDPHPMQILGKHVWQARLAAFLQSLLSLFQLINGPTELSMAIFPARNARATSTQWKQEHVTEHWPRKHKVTASRTRLWTFLFCFVLFWFWTTLPPW